MTNYPLSFSARAESLSENEKTWKTASEPMPPLTGAIPPEFGGPGGGYSPEDFYAFALLNCFMATFKVIADRSKLHYESIHLKGDLTVDRNEKGTPWMKHFRLHARLAGAEDIDRAQRILVKTSESCLVLNSVKTEKTFEFEVTAKA